MIPSITDWLMVIITFVYVVTTVLIFRANKESANASKEELAEMKRQYKEEKRPRIEVELRYEKRLAYAIRFINHGKATAQHVKIRLDEEFIDSLPEQEFKNALRKQREKECIIGVEQHYDLFIVSNELRKGSRIKPVRGEISYRDRNEDYESEFYIDLENYASFFTMGSEDPIVKELNGIKSEIIGLKNAVATLDSSKIGNEAQEKDEK